MIGSSTLICLRIKVEWVGVGKGAVLDDDIRREAIAPQVNLEEVSTMGKMLIVVDMLNDFVHKDGVLSFQSARDIVPFLEERVRHYVETKERMIFLCDSHDKNDKEFERFPKHAVKDTWGAKVIDDLFWLMATNQGIVFDNINYIRKKRYSGFYGTSLAAELNIHKPDEVEVVGVCTSICVMDTVGGLANRDYNIVVPIKGIADFDNEAHEAALTRMTNLYGAKLIGN